MIYTSYFAKLRSLPDNIIPISITGGTPPWFNGLTYKKLAPKYDFFSEWKRDGDDERFSECFREQVLDKLDADKVIDELLGALDVNEEVDIALICYEKPSDFCYRHLVADWFTDNGFECEEWKEN